MWAEFLNQHCQCMGVDLEKLVAALEGRAASEVQPAPVPVPSQLFAQLPVFIEERTVRQMESVIAAVLEATAESGFARDALALAPPGAEFDQKTLGILHGFDFHLTAEGPRLIEVNTNAGGALLNLLLSQTQQICCEAAQPFIVTPHDARALALEESLVEGFRREFARARGDAAVLRRIAIVDEDPPGQFLYAEFLLFAALFRKHGIDAVVVDRPELTRDAGKLWARGGPVDLVYNRLTDFYFEEASSAALRAAYLADEVVVTPAPRHHALLANKRHLATLSDAEAMARLGISEAAIATLSAHVPPAEVVLPENRGRLYRERRKLFFKPLAGYASKAAYRGDKLTRGKFEQIMGEDYLAQAIVAPSERTVEIDGELTKLKLDLRAYVVDAQVLLFAARLYQGQTTNFRTRGGGFAAVLTVPPAFGVHERGPDGVAPEPTGSERVS